MRPEAILDFLRLKMTILWVLGEVFVGNHLQKIYEYSTCQYFSSALIYTVLLVISCDSESAVTSLRLGFILIIIWKCFKVLSF